MHLHKYLSIKLKYRCFAIQQMPVQQSHMQHFQRYMQTKKACITGMCSRDICKQKRHIQF